MANVPFSRSSSARRSAYLFHSSSFFGKRYTMRQRSPFHSGCFERSSICSAMSPGRMTVQGITPAIFFPGPARPRTSPARTRTRFLVCSADPADSLVCGSSTMTNSGRIVRPSGRLYFMPRMRPVMPATRTTAPLDAAPAIVGSTISLAVHAMRVRSPL